MAKKAASLKKQLADAIKLILVITSLASIAAFLSSLGFHKTESHRHGSLKRYTTFRALHFEPIVVDFQCFEEL